MDCHEKTNYSEFIITFTSESAEENKNIFIQERFTAGPPGLLQARRFPERGLLFAGPPMKYVCGQNHPAVN